MRIDNGTYDVLKYLTQIVIPALGTLYFTLSAIWGLPFGNEVVGTLTAIDTFLGVCLELSSKSYREEEEQ